MLGDIKGWNRRKAAKARRLLRAHSIKSLAQWTGGLSNPEKMPCRSFNLPAVTSCAIGTKLRRVEGSVCFKCYAMKGRYSFDSTQEAMSRRERLLRKDPNMWAAAMSLTIERSTGERRHYFRWHDSGDILGPKHLDAIFWIAETNDDVKFWLPTREYGFVLDAGQPPGNLCIRKSVHMVGKAPPPAPGPWSTVGVRKVKHQCPAPKQDGKCGSCRRCWDPKIEVVNYKLH